MSDRARVIAGRKQLRTAPSVLMALAALAAFSVIVLWPVGLHGWLLVVFVGGAVLAVLATRRTGRRGRWLWSAAGFCMGGTLMGVVLRSPFTERRWAGLAALVVLMLLEIWQQQSPRPA